jgi:hypothetical protein
VSHLRAQRAFSDRRELGIVDRGIRKCPPGGPIGETMRRVVPNSAFSDSQTHPATTATNAPSNIAHLRRRVTRRTQHQQIYSLAQSPALSLRSSAESSPATATPPPPSKPRTVTSSLTPSGIVCRRRYGCPADIPFLFFCPQPPSSSSLTC